MKGPARSMETLSIVNGKSGDYFYSDKKDKTLTALAYHYSVKIKTERLIAVTTGKAKREAHDIIKVTIL